MQVCVNNRYSVSVTCLLGRPWMLLRSANKLAISVSYISVYFKAKEIRSHIVHFRVLTPKFNDVLLLQISDDEHPFPLSCFKIVLIVIVVSLM